LKFLLYFYIFKFFSVVEKKRENEKKKGKEEKPRVVFNKVESGIFSDLLDKIRGRWRLGSWAPILYNKYLYYINIYRNWETIPKLVGRISFNLIWFWDLLEIWCFLYNITPIINKIKNNTPPIVPTMIPTKSKMINLSINNYKSEMGFKPWSLLSIEDKIPESVSIWRDDPKGSLMPSLIEYTVIIYLVLLKKISFKRKNKIK